MAAAASDADVVRLRPVEERDLELLQRFATDPALSEPFEWSGFRDAREPRRRWEKDGYLGSSPFFLVVATPDGACAGIVCWWAAGAGGHQERSFEIGILLWPEYRGKGLGVAAQRLLATYLFSTTIANRLQASTDVENVAEQRALERAGFQREGLMRGVAFVAGSWRDGYLYSRLRHDPPPQ
jgi:[ribosomal protein S5]-alanine N-acetyltransferase